MAVDQIDCQDVDELLRNTRLMATGPRRLIYRGQANADWTLTPSAFRKDARFHTEYGPETVEQASERARRLAEEGGYPPPPSDNFRLHLEYETLVRFFNAADEAGLSLPEDSQVIRRTLADSIYGKHDWPDLKLRSILALAQHHGLPTRLLDWTWDVRIALFFAARDVFRQKEPPVRLAVWMLDAGLLESERQLRLIGVPPGGQGLPEKPYRFEIVTAPSATNNNLRAQKGVFTLLVPKADRSEVGADTALDSLPPNRLPLMKQTLPSGLAPEILKRLACEGVTSATVFPDFRGVVLSLEERSLWNRPH